MASTTGPPAKPINYGLIVAFLSIVIAILALALAGQTMQKFNQQEVPEMYDWRAVGTGTMIDWLNTNFVSENEWKPHNDALNEIFENLDSKVDGLQSSVTLLQAKGDVVTQPVPPTQPTITSIDLQLTITDHKGTFRPSGYARDISAILIQGQTTTPDKTYLITIKSPTGNFVKDKFGTTLSDGDISEAWIPLNAQQGRYIVTFTIDAKTDSIEFILL